MAVAIADALGISVAELAGEPSHRIKQSGQWWASWQISRSGDKKIASQQVEIKQEGDLLQVATITRGLSEDEGGYHWSGELRLWDNEILMGWYAATICTIPGLTMASSRCLSTGEGIYPSSKKFSSKCLSTKDSSTITPQSCSIMRAASSRPSMRTRRALTRSA